MNKFGGKYFIKLNSAEFMELVFSKSVHDILPVLIVGVATLISQPVLVLSHIPDAYLADLAKPVLLYKHIHYSLIDFLSNGLP